MTWLFILLCFFPLALAQPYMAAEGFSRPLRLAESASIPGLSVAVEGEQVHAYWRDREGAYRLDLTEAGATPEQFVVARGVRSLEAASYDGETALALVIQDIETGRTEHSVRWQGEEKLVFEALAPSDMSLAVGSEPLLVYSRTLRGVDTLYLWRWSSGQEVLYSSNLSIEKAAVWTDDAGKVVVSWLEGSNDGQAVGVSASDWNVNYLQVTPQSEAISLGAASNLGIATRSYLFGHQNEAVLVWTNEAGVLTYQLLGENTGGTLESGFPAGIADGYIYWTNRDSIRRLALGNDLSNAENIIWTNNLPEQTKLITQKDEIFLAWYGGPGGQFELYGSNTLRPLVPNWQDRVAAQMGWRPYRFWSSAISQSLFSIFAGLMTALAFTPLLWLLSLLMSSVVRLGWSKRAGLLLGIIAVSGLLLTASLYSSRRFVVTPLEWFLAVALAASLSWLVIRQRDLESEGGLLLSSSLTIFISMSVLSFLRFRDWLGPWLSGF